MIIAVLCLSVIVVPLTCNSPSINRMTFYILIFVLFQVWLLLFFLYLMKTVTWLKQKGTVLIFTKMTIAGNNAIAMHPYHFLRKETSA